MYLACHLPLPRGWDNARVLADDHDAGADDSSGLVCAEDRDRRGACGVVPGDECVDIRVGGDVDFRVEDLHPQRHVRTRVGHDMLAVVPSAFRLDALSELQNLFEDVADRLDGIGVQRDDLAADAFGRLQSPELRGFFTLVDDSPDSEHRRSCLECQLRVGDVAERQIRAQVLFEPFKPFLRHFPEWLQHAVAP